MNLFRRILAWLRHMRQLHYLSAHFYTECGKRGTWMNPLKVNFGDTVRFKVNAHSALNGAKIPQGSSVKIQSNDPTVATLPESIEIPAGGASELDMECTVLGPGATDGIVDVVTPDGTPFHVSASLIVSQVGGEDGTLASLSAEFYVPGTPSAFRG